jgi:hypothetical protein
MTTVWDGFERDEPELSSGVANVSRSAITELMAEFRKALHEAQTRTLADQINMQNRQALRAAIRSFSLSCREAGIAPESTLVTLKQALRRVSPADVEMRPTSEHDTEHDLIADIVAWCIEDYYRGD